MRLLISALLCIFLGGQALAATGTGYLHSASPNANLDFQQLIPGSNINISGSTTGDLLCANGGVVGDCGGLAGAALAPKGLNVTGNIAITAGAIVNSVWSDTTSVIGSPATFWNPAYYGNAATGLVDHMNRLLVGAASLVSNDILSSTGLPTTSGWIDALLGSPLVGISQIASGSTIGAIGIIGYTRTSDYRTWTASASAGSEGLIGFAYNDDTGSGAPIACGVCGISARKTGVGGVTLNQYDIENAGSVVTETPYGGVTGGSTFGVGFTTGAYPTLGTANVSAAWYVGQSGTPVFQIGGIFFNGSLNTSIGAGGNGVAMEYARGMSERWLNSGGTTDAEIWGNAAGLNFSGALTEAGNLIINATSSGLIVAQQNGVNVWYTTGSAFQPANDNEISLGISASRWSALFVAGAGEMGGLIETAAAPTVSVGQVGFGSTVAATGNCGTLSGDAGCLVINVAGTTRYVPYY